MKKVLLLGLASVAMVVGGLTAAESMNSTPEIRDAHIIVQLKQDTKGKTAQQVKAYQNKVLSYIGSNITANFELNNRYTNLLSGFSLDVPAAYVNDIRELPYVERVNYNQMRFYQEDDGASYTLRKAPADGENVSADTMHVPNENNGGEGVLIGILDTGFLLETDDGKGNILTHEIYNELDPGVKLKVTQESLRPIINAEGFHGKPDQTHSTYHNNKVPFFCDYGRNRYEQIGEISYNVYNKESDHGNHCAAIAAGNAPTFKGIAPKAQLALMKVFTGGGAYDEAVILALEDAAAIGCDVVNMSFGTNLVDYEDGSIVNNLIKKVTEEGMYCNVAAGNAGKGMFSNSGAYANWTTDLTETGIICDSANNPSSITVAAAQADKEYYESALVIDEHNISYQDQITSGYDYPEEILLSDLCVGSETSLPWVFIPNYGEAKDYEGKDAAGKVAIINRGETTFVQKITEAVNHGAIAVGIINNDPTDTSFTFHMDLTGYTPKCPIFIILYRDKEIFENSTSNEVKLISKQTFSNPTAGQVTSFTSDGGLYDYRLKPEISSPGQSIKGAIYLTDDNKYATDAYAYWDGTSMATPNYCGAIALMLGSHLNDDNYVKTVNARAMSTADQIKDYTLEVASPRIQGAGMVNVEKALTTKAFLHGEDPTRAKIELLNNDDIKQGNVNLSFTGVNESDTTINYTATTYVYRPSIVRTEINEEKSTIYDNVDFQGITNTKIATKSQSVTLNPNGETLITLDSLQLPQEEKDYIDDHFENGCPIEGYVVLEAEGEVTLSIPFLGYYGNPSDAMPVEPFKFEKDPNKVYPSDVLHEICRIGGYSAASYGSDIVDGYFKRETWSDEAIESPLTGWISNTSSLYSVKGDNGKNVDTVTNTEEDGKYTIYTANNTNANTLIITQMVTRSVKTNVLTIKNKATQETILVDHMYDSLRGAVEDAEGEEIAWPLTRSLCDIDLFSDGYITSRAYTILALWNSDTKVDYPDGEYDLDIDYETNDGKHHKLSYNLVIESKIPEITTSEIDSQGGYTRYNLDDTNITKVTANGKKEYIPQHDDRGYYINIPHADFPDGKVVLKIYDSTGNVTNLMTYLQDEDHFIFKSDELTTTISYEIKKEASGDHGLLVTTKFIKTKKTYTLSKPVEVKFKLFEGISVADLTITDYTGKTKKENRDFTYDDATGYITFLTTLGKFILSSDSINPSSYISTEESSQPVSSSSEVVSSSSVEVSSSISESSSVEVSSSSIEVSSSVEVSSSSIEVSSESSIASSSQAATSSESGSSGGCGGSVAAGSLLTLIIALSSIALVSKKKED